MVNFLYIHIPFCIKKCKYCSFVSVENTELIGAYVDSLVDEIKFRYNAERLQTIYFGGGTPSLLSTKYIAKVLENLNFDKNTEVTLEANPQDINEKYLSELKSLGINRVSVGVQVFDDNLLKLIGRRHTVQEAKTAINLIKNSGVENISLDLIYGLPYQDMRSYEKTLIEAVNTNVTHISLYGLKIDEGCYFFKHQPLNLPDDELQAQMYLLSKEILESNGYLHYEISNFAKKGYESRHNLNYWNCNEYYGFGAAAHGFVNGIRYENKSVVVDYIKTPLIVNTQHKLSKREKLEEAIFLGFRKMEGINTAEINSRFGIDFDEKYKKITDKYLAFKHIEKTLSGYKLTKEGVLLSNYFLSEFVE